MMSSKHTLMAATLAGLSTLATATTLAPGDLYFTGMARESAYGGWSFVSFVDIEAGTSITFSDNGLTSGGVFKPSVQKENTWVWTASSNLAAGTQVVVFGGSYNTTSGSLSGGSSGQGGQNVTSGSLAVSPTADALAYQFDFSNSGEVLYALQGSTFIAAMNSFTAPPASTSDNPLATGLPFIQNLNYTAANGGTGDGVVQRTEWYRGPTAGLTADEYKAAIANMANWDSDTSTSAFKGLALLEGAGQAAVLAGDAVGRGAGNFQISPVPEPGSWGLLLAGLGVVAGVARRRRG
jgi:hypothetical protein